MSRGDSDGARYPSQRFDPSAQLSGSSAVEPDPSLGNLPRIVQPIRPWSSAITMF